jgi:drug/metabolite transporter (DMT)-like permease
VSRKFTRGNQKRILEHLRAGDYAKVAAGRVGIDESTYYRWLQRGEAARSYAVLSLPILRKYSPLVVAAYTMLFGGLTTVPFALPGFVDAEWHRVGTLAWAALAYSTLFVAAVGFYAWQRGVSEVGANRVLVYQYLVTLVGVASGVVLLGEDLTPNKLGGGIVVLFGVYLARRR